MFSIHCSNFLTHNFFNICENFLSLVLLESMAKWNIKVENISEKRRIKIEKNEDESFNFLSKADAVFKIWLQKFQSFLIMKFFFFFLTFFVKILNKTALVSLTVKFGIYKFLKKFCWYWCFFSVKQLINNDTSGNRESVIYCFTFNFNFIAPFYGWGPTASRL